LNEYWPCIAKKVCESHCLLLRANKTGETAVRSTGPKRRLTDDEIRAAISYLEPDPEARKYHADADAGIVILFIVIVIAFLTLFFHVANS
jgi:hypothetical protein